MDGKFFPAQFRSTVVGVVMVVVCLSYAVPGTSPIGISGLNKHAAHWQRRRAICFIQHRNGRGDRREFLEAVSQPELGGSRSDTRLRNLLPPQPE